MLDPMVNRSASYRLGNAIAIHSKACLIMGRAPDGIRRKRYTRTPGRAISRPSWGFAWGERKRPMAKVRPKRRSNLHSAHCCKG